MSAAGGLAGGVKDAAGGLLNALAGKKADSKSKKDAK